MCRGPDRTMAVWRYVEKSPTPPSAFVAIDTPFQTPSESGNDYLVWWYKNREVNLHTNTGLAGGRPSLLVDVGTPGSLAGERRLQVASALADEHGR